MSTRRRSRSCAAVGERGRGTAVRRGDETEFKQEWQEGAIIMPSVVGVNHFGNELNQFRNSWSCLIFSKNHSSV